MKSFKLINLIIEASDQVFQNVLMFYRVFLNYCVFSLKCCDFPNFQVLLVFDLPSGGPSVQSSVNTLTQRENQEKSVQTVMDSKSLEKNHNI